MFAGHGGCVYAQMRGGMQQTVKHLVLTLAREETAPEVGSGTADININQVNSVGEIINHTSPVDVQC
jgi:hypothetical protein